MPLLRASASALPPLLLALALAAAAAAAPAREGGGACEAAEDSQALLQLGGSAAEGQRPSSAGVALKSSNVTAGWPSSWPSSWSAAQRDVADRLLGRWTDGPMPGFNTWKFEKRDGALQGWDSVFKWGVASLQPEGRSLTFGGLLVHPSGQQVLPARRVYRFTVESGRMKKTWTIGLSPGGPLWYSRCGEAGKKRCRCKFLPC